MPEHLFLFTITPVQSFVEQARKTQDLYAGSFLLSHLCRTAARKMKEDYNGRIIFPDIDNKSIPNRFLAVVETAEARLPEVGRILQEASETEFRRIANAVVENLAINKPEGFDGQISSYFTVNWVFIPFEGSAYERSYTGIESIMGAMKTVRVFQQFPDSEKGRKCTVCGDRNIKFYRSKNGESEHAIKKKKLFSGVVFIVNDKENDGHRKLEPRYLQSGEGLCAVCFTKRCLDKVFNVRNEYNPDFPSTAEIALFDALEKLKELTGSLTFGKYEPQGVFALMSSFRNNTEKEDTKKLHSALKNNKISCSPYYAVMLFDGDSMGEWLSGDKIKGGQLKEFHETLTKSLGEFAGEVRDTIKRPMGVTVYAGGEDFLGFFNLSKLLNGMRTLRDKFDGMVNKPLKPFFADTSLDMTFSAGVVIAHIKTPLSEVLSWARKMEHEAKGIDDDKDAFSIAVLRHSGDIDKTVSKWKVGDLYATEILREISDELTSDRLSDTFINSLNIELLRLVDADGKYAADHIISSELKRLIARSCIRGKDENKESFDMRKKATVENLTTKLSAVWVSSKSAKAFVSFINVAEFLARRLKSEAS